MSAASPSPGPVLLVSDVHARYQVIQAQLEHAEQTLGAGVSQVLVLGDFGLFGPELHAHFRRAGARFSRPVAFVEGNHEDYCGFERLVRAYADVVTHLPRGSVHRFGPWRTVCVGGARYMDAWSTPSGSAISDADVAACLAHGTEPVDLVVSHDCPTGIGVRSDPALVHLGPPGDPGLAEVASRLRPRWWCFGHHHRWHDREHQGTRFVGLPQSWDGYALLHASGKLDLVERQVGSARRAGLWSWLRSR